MKYLIVCIGNRDGGDDSVGPYIADRLKGRKEEDFDVLDVGITPENYTGVIKEKNPDILVIIDAVDMQLSAGEIRIIPPDSIGVMHVSTHGIPLSVIIKYLKQYIHTVILIGIQPETMDGDMSKTVKQSANHLIEILTFDAISSIQMLDT